MKRFVLLAALACCMGDVQAQNEKGGFSIKPVAGVNISTLGNTSTGLYHTKVGMTGGIEAEYGVANWFGLSLGMLYSEQGAKLKGGAYTIVTENNQQTIVATSIKGKLKATYLNLPLLANIYIPKIKGLALKTGVQLGILTSSKMNTDIAIASASSIPTGEIQFNDQTNQSTYQEASFSASDVCKSVDVAIPVGISYEYKNISLDARYHFGLTKIDKTENPDTAHNRYLSLTLGYRFHL